MRVLVIGGGGREHAIIRKIKENPNVTVIYALPGNGGMRNDAQCFPVGAKDLDGIEAFVKEHPVDFAVVAPDDPLVLGAVNRLEALGIPTFGPRAEAAIIEGSKVFSKNLMKKYGIPTADYTVCSTPEEALEAVRRMNRYPVVLKADGLALGKGVLIASTKQEAEEAIRSLMVDRVFGQSGSRIVVEEFLTGPEVSVLSFTDGKTVVPMVSSMDHKRALDGDRGLNTGGMGTIAPNPYYTPEIAKQCMDTIFRPTVEAMNREGRTFKGCLYFGLMLTPDGPKVIEYNCRFGDPETQVVLPLLKTDLLTVMQATAAGKLDSCPVEWKEESACCVVMASEGYPGKYETGFEISVDPDCKAEIYCAGVKTDPERGVPVSGGGRVLGVVMTAPTLEQAVKDAYAEVKKVHFKNAFYRHDIGQRALLVKKES